MMNVLLCPETGVVGIKKLRLGAELVADEWNASEDAELHQNEADEDDRPPKGDVAAHEAGLHLD